MSELCLGDWFIGQRWSHLSDCVRVLLLGGGEIGKHWVIPDGYWGMQGVYACVCACMGTYIRVALSYV